jgi:hypothetical protein
MSGRRLSVEALEDRCLLTASVGDTSPAVELAFGAAAGGWTAELTGAIVDSSGVTHQLSIAPRSAHQGTLIDPNRMTWLVIHGRLGAAADRIYQDIAASIDQFDPDDQVLLLDWETAATGLAAGESRIEAVGRWAGAALDDYGVDASMLNLLGYSWGTYVADELAEEIQARQLQPVSSIILLDPATDIWGNAYNPDNTSFVNFAAHSEFSWAFHSSVLEGSEVSPTTAHESFVVHNSSHYTIRDQFIRILDTNHGGQLQNEYFSLGRLLGRDNPPVPWLTDGMNASGGLAYLGGYEASIDMDDSLLAESLTYASPQGPPNQSYTEPFWTAVAPDAVDDHYTIDMALWNGSVQVDAASGLLSNDTGNTLTASRLTGPLHGDLNLGEDGSFTYTPWLPPTIFGFSDEFTYEVTDLAGLKDTAQVILVGTANLHNGALPTDVNNSATTTPLDALLIINALNAYGAQTVDQLAQRGDVPAYYFDVNGNGEVTAADVLEVITHLNAISDAGAEGEASLDLPLQYPAGELGLQLDVQTQGGRDHGRKTRLVQPVFRYRVRSDRFDGFPRLTDTILHLP